MKAKLVFVSFIALATLVVGKEQNEIVAKFLEQSNGTVSSFESVRYISASNQKPSLSADVVVQANLTENTNLDFRVISKTGSEFIQGKILEYLDKEKKTTKTVNPAIVAFNSQNYLISLKSSGEDGLVQLWNKPLRKDDFLIDGVLFINKTGELNRVEGKLVKSPSMMISSVSIVRSYLNFGDIRLVKQQDLVANLRFKLGQTEMHTRFVYNSVNGKVVGNE